MEAKLACREFSEDLHFQWGRERALSPQLQPKRGAQREVIGELDLWPLEFGVYSGVGCDIPREEHESNRRWAALRAGCPSTKSRGKNMCFSGNNSARNGAETYPQRRYCIRFLGRLLKITTKLVA